MLNSTPYYFGLSIFLGLAYSLCIDIDVSSAIYSCRAVTNILIPFSVLIIRVGFLRTTHVLSRDKVNLYHLHIFVTYLTL